MTMPVFNSSFPANITAFTSDRTVDFTLNKINPDLTTTQRSLLLSRLGFEVPEPAPILQVHGDQVITVDEDFLKKRPVLPEADGLMTRIPGHPLTVRTADCLPVFMYDPACRGISLIHVGHRGAAKNILREAVTQMKTEWRTETKAIKVFWGPSIRSCCYEVGEEFQERFPEDLIVKDGRYYLELVQACKKQLTSLGLQEENMTDCGICTCCDSNYFSYRREGETAGRMISLIMLREG
jgi:YfiH family protein